MQTNEEPISILMVMSTAAAVMAASIGEVLISVYCIQCYCQEKVYGTLGIMGLRNEIRLPAIENE